MLIPNFINGSSKWASVWSAGTDLVEESVWIWEGYNAKISPDIEWMPGKKYVGFFVFFVLFKRHGDVVQ